MGLGGIGIWQLVIILVIVVLIFGTKKLKNMGGDIGGAVKNFKTAVKDEKGEAEANANAEKVADDVAEKAEDVAQEVKDTADKV